MTAPDPSLRAIVLGNAPRFVRDAVGPVVVFYTGWKAVGLVTGIVAATALTTAVFVWERRRGRTGLGASIGFTIALVQAATGLAAGSATWYFAPQVIANTLAGLVFLGSVIVGRPLAGVFATDSYPFAPEVKASAAFARVFGRISLVWAAYLLARGALRTAMLVSASIEAFLAVSIATGIPLGAALTAWSFWYAARGVHPRSPSGPPGRRGTA